MRLDPIRPGLAALAVVALAGCGSTLNHASTINQVKQVKGTTTETAVQQQLAKLGFPAARVSCAKTMIVNVGAKTSCSVTGAGTKDIVRFTYTSSKGAIDLSSVKVS